MLSPSEANSRTLWWDEHRTNMPDYARCRLPSRLVETESIHIATSRGCTSDDVLLHGLLRYFLQIISSLPR